MEVISQTPIASPYVTAPTSPCAFSLDPTLYHSAPTSPTKRIGNPFSDLEYASLKTISTSSNSDDFEFETSKKFGNICMEIETSHVNLLDWSVDDGLLQERHQQHERGGSLPTMAFADELFCNGQVMPLKLPPRLQYRNETKSFSQGSIASSPRSPSSVFKAPFARGIVWKNDFDPFMVALQKVTEEKRGRRRSENHHIHRRTRSHSPFRTTTLERSTEDVHLKPMQNSGPDSVRPMEPKSFIYARWVRDQTKHVKTSPKRAISEQHKSSVTVETKMQRIKGLLLKYASFGRKNNGTKLDRISAIWKPAYFTRMSFKFKRSANGNGKDQGKMEVAKYKPAALCIGYGIESPRN